MSLSRPVSAWDQPDELALRVPNGSLGRVTTASRMCRVTHSTKRPPLRKKKKKLYKYRRCYVSVAMVDRVIYAMGGFDGHHRLSSAEKYSFERNQWTMIAPMTSQRSDACAAVLNGEWKQYVRVNTKRYAHVRTSRRVPRRAGGRGERVFTGGGGGGAPAVGGSWLVAAGLRRGAQPSPMNH